MVSFNKANITQDDNGRTFLDLEIQAVFNDQIVIIRNSFPATTNYQASACQQPATETNQMPENSDIEQVCCK